MSVEKIEKDYNWVKKCIESCIHPRQLETARNLVEAYERKWLSELKEIGDVVVNVGILSNALRKKQDELK